MEFEEGMALVQVLNTQNDIIQRNSKLLKDSFRLIRELSLECSKMATRLHYLEELAGVHTYTPNPKPVKNKFEVVK